MSISACQSREVEREKEREDTLGMIWGVLGRENKEAN